MGDVCSLGIFSLKTFVLTSLCIHAHQEQGLSVKHIDLHNLPPYSFIQTSAWEPWKIEPFTYVIFSGFSFLRFL